MPTIRMLCATLILSASLAACGGGTAAGPDQNPDDTLIGPAGGIVRDPSGTITLTVPANALTTPTRVTVASSSENFIDPAVLNSSRVAVGPANVVFAVPARLTFSYAPDDRPDGTAEDELQVVTRLGSSWVQVATAMVNTTQHAVATPVQSGGTFAVRWYPTHSCTISNQFDFWIGEWNFSAPNAFPGTDRVTRNGCLLEEDFLDSNNAHGRSISFLSTLDGKWHQTYVDSQEGRFIFSGSLQTDGTMLLSTSATERFGWKLLDANTVRYYGERTTNAGQSWTVFFDGRYRR